jgi:hypothetical protein
LAQVRRRHSIQRDAEAPARPPGAYNQPGPMSCAALSALLAFVLTGGPQLGIRRFPANADVRMPRKPPYKEALTAQWPPQTA